MDAVYGLGSGPNTLPPRPLTRAERNRNSSARYRLNEAEGIKRQKDAEIERRMLSTPQSWLSPLGI
jgi:hypothetical protein